MANMQNNQVHDDIFKRNLTFMVDRIAADKSKQTLDMLETMVPHVKDFHQLRALTTAFVENDCKPFKRVPIDSAVDHETLKGEAKLRFHDGFFLLTETEDMVFRGNEAHGPYAKNEVAFMAKKLGAESMTNDKKGHILDPEVISASVMTIS